MVAVLVCALLWCVCAAAPRSEPRPRSCSEGKDPLIVVKQSPNVAGSFVGKSPKFLSSRGFIKCPPAWDLACLKGGRRRCAINDDSTVAEVAAVTIGKFLGMERNVVNTTGCVVSAADLQKAPRGVLFDPARRMTLVNDLQLYRGDFTRMAASSRHALSSKKSEIESRTRKLLQYSNKQLSGGSLRCSVTPLIQGLQLIEYGAQELHMVLQDGRFKRHVKRARLTSDGVYPPKELRLPEGQNARLEYARLRAFDFVIDNRDRFASVHVPPFGHNLFWVPNSKAKSYQRFLYVDNGKSLGWLFDTRHVALEQHLKHLLIDSRQEVDPDTFAKNLLLEEKTKRTPGRPLLKQAFVFNQTCVFPKQLRYQIARASRCGEQTLAKMILEENYLAATLTPAQQSRLAQGTLARVRHLHEHIRSCASDPKNRLVVKPRSSSSRTSTTVTRKPAPLKQGGLTGKLPKWLMGRLASGGKKGGKKKK